MAEPARALTRVAVTELSIMFRFFTVARVLAGHTLFLRLPQIGRQHWLAGRHLFGAGQLVSVPSQSSALPGLVYAHYVCGTTEKKGLAIEVFLDAQGPSQ